MNRFRVGIAGCGAIGQAVAQTLDAGLPGLTLAAVAVRDPNAPPAFGWKSGAPTFTTTGWNWVGANPTTRASIEVTAAGPHTINAWMREDGFYFDKLIITTDADFSPTDVGPAESASTGGGATPTISVARNATGGPVITYTGTLQRATSLGTPTNWTDVSGAVSPYTAPPTAPQEYYRARQ